MNDNASKGGCRRGVGDPIKSTEPTQSSSVQELPASRLAEIRRDLEQLSSTAEAGPEDSCYSESIRSIIDFLRELEPITISREILKSTQIGRQVGALRTHREDRIRELANKLVTTWKAALQDNKKVSRNEDRKRIRGSSPVDLSSRRPPTPWTADHALEGIRKKAAEFIFCAFYDGLAPELSREQVAAVFDPAKTINLAVNIEAALEHSLGSTSEYTSQLKKIKFNLADPSNQTFSQNLYTGAVVIHRLPTMASEMMASEELKEKRKLALQEAKDACRTDWRAKSDPLKDGQFTCFRCGSKKTAYYQMQTRSADEPMTTYVTCYSCKHRWKM